MTHTINISANFTATVNVSDSCVVITTNYFNTKRSSSFDSVADAIKNTSIPAVAKLLSSI